MTRRYRIDAFVIDDGLTVVARKTALGSPCYSVAAVYKCEESPSGWYIDGDWRMYGPDDGVTSKLDAVKMFATERKKEDLHVTRPDRTDA